MGQRGSMLRSLEDQLGITSEQHPHGSNAVVSSPMFSLTPGALPFMMASENHVNRTAYGEAQMSTTTMRMAIVEDDAADAQALSAALERYLASRETPYELARFTGSDDFLFDWPRPLDLLFLDIQMPGIDGMELAERVRENDEKVAIVFVTNTPDYSLRGYQVDASAYLVKPLSYEQFSQQMDRVWRKLDHVRGDFIAIRNAEGSFVVNTNDISCIELLGRRITVHTHSGDIAYSGAIGTLEQQLPDTFFRCHSSFIVSLKEVESIQGNEVTVAGRKVPVSRHRRKEFVEALSAYLGTAI